MVRPLPSPAERGLPMAEPPAARDAHRAGGGQWPQIAGMSVSAKRRTASMKPFSRRGENAPQELQGGPELIVLCSAALVAVSRGAWAAQAGGYPPQPPGGSCLPGWTCQYSRRSWQRPSGAKLSSRQPGRVISPWSGSIMVAHHSTATRPARPPAAPCVRQPHAGCQRHPASTGGSLRCRHGAGGRRWTGSTHRGEQADDLVGVGGLPGPPVTLDPLLNSHRQLPSGPRWTPVAWAATVSATRRVAGPARSALWVDRGLLRSSRAAGDAVRRGRRLYLVSSANRPVLYVLRAPYSVVPGRQGRLGVAARATPCQGPHLVERRA